VQIALDSVTTAGWLILAVTLSARRQNAPMQLNPSAIEDLEAAGVKEVGCRILRNLWKNFRACLNAVPTAVAGYF
jgi:hypothetical protein